MIKIESLTKKYHSATAVDNISFEVKRGEILGFLGANGAGKTTTIKIITTSLLPTSGSVKVDGQDVLKDSLSIRKKIGYLPENVTLYPEMRVQEYLKFRSKLKNIPKKKLSASINGIMEQCLLTDVKKRIIGQLSKGYRQRVGLAEALLGAPPLLVLDEPTVGLDPNQIRSARKIIESLAPLHTVFLSTHILPEVEMVCDRVIIIDKGRIVAVDSPQNLRGKASGIIKITAEIKGGMNKVDDMFSGFSGVKVTDKIPVEDFTRYSLEAKEDVRSVIYQKCVLNKFVLRELTMQKASLEDVFVKITETEKEPRERESSLPGPQEKS